MGTGFDETSNTNTKNEEERGKKRERDESYFTGKILLKQNKKIARPSASIPPT